MSFRLGRVGLGQLPTKKSILPITYRQNFDFFFFKIRIWIKYLSDWRSKSVRWRLADNRIICPPLHFVSWSMSFATHSPLKFALGIGQENILGSKAICHPIFVYISSITHTRHTIPCFSKSQVDNKLSMQMTVIFQN
jgi:hypothetical protein